jgi:predicted lipoprotein
MKKLSLVAISAVMLSACNGTSTGTSSSIDSCKALDSDTFSCEQMLSDVVEFSVKPVVAALGVQTQNLATKTSAYCGALTTANEASTLAEAQTAWQETMNVWQQLEVMQFGPVKAARDDFYTWPLNDSCKVDEEVLFSLADGYDISTGVTPARRGLDGLEYLLFNSNMAISCAAANTTPALDSWDNDKSDVAKRADRCAFADKIATDLVTRSSALNTSINSFDLSTSAGSLHEAANLVSDGLFYIDKKTKDAKLAAQLPQTTDDTFKPDNLEFKFSSYAKESIHNNLLAAKAILTANNHTGLAQYLIAAGQDTLATDMLAKIDTAVNSSSTIAINDSFRNIMTAASSADVTTCINAVSGSAVSNLEKLCTLDDDIKSYTDDLKGQFVLTLSFTVPSDAEGDND